MGNCLQRCTSIDRVESESQSMELPPETISSIYLEFLIELADRLNLAENPWIQEEFNTVGRLCCFPIGVYVPREQAAGGNSQDCAICLQDFVAGEHVLTLSCKHFFHLVCINEWLMTSFTCPCCRLPM